MMITMRCKDEVCAHTEFEINSEEQKFICCSCKSEVAMKIEEYSTYKNSCNKCNSNKFKVRINSEENEVEDLTVECIECNNRIKKYYIDKDGIEISKEYRQQLIINDSLLLIKKQILELKEEVLDLRYDVERIDYNMSSIESEVSIIDDKLEKLDDTVKYL